MGSKASAKRANAVSTPGGGALPPAPPAYFLSLTVENVRCFGPKVELDFSHAHGRPAHWTVILGDNGVGKTTLLQCLAALEARIRTLPKTLTSAGLREAVPAINTWPIDWQRGFLRGDGEVGAAINSVVGTGPRLAEQSTCCRRLPFGWTGSWVPPGLMDTSSDQRWGSIGGLKCYGYGALRRMGESLLTSNGATDGALDEAVFGASKTLFREEAELINAEEWLARKDYAAAKGQSKAKEQLEGVKELLLAVLPEDAVTDIRITSSTQHADSAMVELQTPYGRVPLSKLSLGFQTVVAWMVDLAARLFERYPDSPNPLAEPAIVLVDEIDLHLHPRWQREIQSYLTQRFPNTQFIVTAHSPLVVQAAADANIALLRQEGDHVVIDNDPATIKGWRVDQVLTSDLFGLPTARSPEIERLFEERAKLIQKKKRTKAQEQRLKVLDEIVESLPGAESPEDREAMEVIRKAAKRIRELEGEGS